MRQAPVFDNVVATLRLDGRDARLRIERARPSEDGRVVGLETAFEAHL